MSLAGSNERRPDTASELRSPSLASPAAPTQRCYAVDNLNESSEMPGGQSV